MSGDHASSAASLRLPSVFSDHMVMQRDLPLPIWGWAKAGESVSVELGERRGSATADEKGRWSLRLAALAAGGPLELVVWAGEETVTIHDVLIGEVWVASGQSNMEWILVNSNDAPAEIAAADYPRIRFMKVAQKTSATPLEDVRGGWEVCRPETAQSISAVGYFFARHLYKTLEVPIGFIDSSWGGTQAQAWTSREGLAAEPSLRYMLDHLEAAGKDYPRLKAEYETKLKEWTEKVYHKDPGNKGVEWGWAKPDAAVGDWKPMHLPGLWQRQQMAFNGAMWFRREVELPAEWAGRDLSLELGAIDDFDHSYFNGVHVGRIGPENPNAYAAPRIYTVPGQWVKAGTNVIAVRVFDHYGMGGLTGPALSMRVGLADGSAEALPLSGEWLFKVELALEPKNAPMPAVPFLPDSNNAPCAIYNAMIHPLIPYAMRGVIWYQGESNAHASEQYATLFPAMIRAWRRAWGQGNPAGGKERAFPFLFVQLANYMPRKPQPAESAWAELREAQLKALSMPNTAMAVAIDIGQDNDIHPRNKQDVGTRLALAAEAFVYGRDTIGSGPIYESMRIEGSSIRVRFKHADGLRTKGDQVRGFALAGEDRRFVWASARIDGSSVVVSSPEVAAPAAVRYGWADNPDANLYNGADLPASPFRSDTLPGVTAGLKA